MLDEWKNWCRLCAKENRNEIDVLVKDENISNLSQIIHRFFSIEIISSDGISTSICLDCHKFISDVVTFSQRSERVQSMYSQLKFSSNDLSTLWIDLEALRDQFGILSENQSKYKNQITDTSDLHDDNDYKFDEKVHLCHLLDNEQNEIKNFNENNKKNEKNITEIDYLDEELLEIKHENECDDKFHINVKEQTLELNKPKRSIKQNKEQFVCDICEKEFKHEQNYRYHLKVGHSKRNKIGNKFHCEKCNKSFSTKNRLKNHDEIHLQLLYSCPFCDKSFTKKGNLHSHVRGIHDNEKPYICEECGKAFSTCGALKEHKYTHIDDTPYECPKCQKKFKNKARLKTHTDTHNDTTYVCTTCGLQLNTRRTLLMHMVVHSDQKKHKCNFCGNEYKRAKALKNHLILHTGLRPYSCPFCEKTFANGSNCRSHKKKAHPKELAALEASGQKTSITNIPKLEQLKSVATVDAKIRSIKPEVLLNDNLLLTNNLILNIGEQSESCIAQQSCFEQLQMTLS